MSARTTLEAAEEQAIVAAIGRAERGHRGEIRVHIGLRSEGDTLLRAREAFFRLGLDKTNEGTGVLLYVAPNERRAAVYAGAGIYPARQPLYWQRVIDTVAIHARKNKLAEGMIAAIELIGEVLRASMPSDDPAGDELPNTVTKDESTD